MERVEDRRGLLGSVYAMLRGIMITIGITPPAPGHEGWVAIVFFGVCALFVIGMLALGVQLLHWMR